MITSIESILKQHWLVHQFEKNSFSIAQKTMFTVSLNNVSGGGNALQVTQVT